MKTKNGQTLWGLFNAQVIFKKGKPDSLFTFAQDISELKQTQQALKESETRYQQLFDSMTEMFLVADLVYDESGKIIDFVYVDVNKAFLKHVNKNKNQIIGKRHSEIFKIRANQAPEIINQVVKSGKSHRFTVKGLGNHYFDVLIWKASKNQVGCTFGDITETKLLEKQLQDKERMAAIGETAGMVGHDLRNPLQTIIGELYLAKSELDEIPEGQTRATMQESIESIEEQASYMDKIVSDLQTFVKPVHTNKQLVDLNELVESTLDQIKIPENIQAKTQLKDKLTIETDPQLLKRVLINLITNSIQAMPKGGKVAIKAQVSKKNQMVLEVEDTGEGIPEEIKPKIFTPLFTTKSRGQGFGLSVCKRVIEAQGGTISFESQVGKGTKFIISLPSNQSK